MDVLSGLGIIILGLIAWAFPVVNLVRRKKSENKSWIAFSITSVSAFITLALNLITFLVYSIIQRK